jgi:hypothetical protein
MIIACSAQTVSQKLLASEEQPASFLQSEEIKSHQVITDVKGCQATGCDTSLAGNGTCDYYCNNSVCKYDSGDCGDFKYYSY